MDDFLGDENVDRNIMPYYESSLFLSYEFGEHDIESIRNYFHY